MSFPPLLTPFEARPLFPRARGACRPGAVLARNDPLNIFGNQRQHTLLIAAAYCCKEILHNLDILFDTHRNFSISLTSDRVRSNRTFWNPSTRAKSHGRRSITAAS